MNEAKLLELLNGAPLGVQKLILKETAPFELDIKSLGVVAYSGDYSQLFNAVKAVVPEMAEKKSSCKRKPTS